MMLVLEVLGLLGMPLITFFAVSQQWRGRVLLPVLFILLGVLLYVGGDMHGWRMIWYGADWIVVLLILQVLHTPAFASHYEAKLWDRIPRVDADLQGMRQDLHGWLHDPRLSYPGLSLKLDLNGDLLVAAKMNGQWGRRRFRAVEGCPHCVLESLVSALVAEEPVEVLEEYRTGISGGEGRAVDIYYGGQPHGVVMHVIDANRQSPPAEAGCTLHSR